jgi:hypothetical protein
MAHLLRLERVDYPVAAAQRHSHADEGAVQGNAGMQQGAQHGVEYYALDTAGKNIREQRWQTLEGHPHLPSSLMTCALTAMTQ